MDAQLLKQDGREIAAEHDTQVLRWLGRFGWLSARECARLVWPDASQGHRMAQRSLRRLTDAKAVLRRSLPTGGVAYVIARRGARQLRELGDETVSGRRSHDLKFKAPAHRSICNNYAIDHISDPTLRIYTEAEIEARRAPQLFLPVNGHVRIPDLLIAQGNMFEWIEVENTPKSQSRLDALVEVAVRVLTLPPNEATPTNLLRYRGKDAGVVHRFRFVCPSDSTVRACWGALERYGIEKLIEEFGYDIYLERVQMSSGLVWGGSLWDAPILTIHQLRMRDGAEATNDPEPAGDDDQQPPSSSISPSVATPL